MGTLVLQMGVSIDGFVAAADGSHPWGEGREDPAQKRWTYQEMAAFWLTSSDEYAAPMNEIPKVVFSKTLESADWGPAQVARGDLGEEIAQLERETANDLIAYPTGTAIHVYRPRRAA